MAYPGFLLSSSNQSLFELCHSYCAIVRYTDFAKKTSKLDITDKSNLHVHFGYKAMASLYDLLCYHSLTTTDPLLKDLLAYLPTRFHSHIFDYIAYEHSSDDESVHSTNFSTSVFYSDDSTYFLKKLLYFFYVLCNSKYFTAETGTRK